VVVVLSWVPHGSGEDPPMPHDVVAPAVVRDACAHGERNARKTVAVSAATAFRDEEEKEEEEEDLVVGQLEKYGLVLKVLILLAAAAGPGKPSSLQPSLAPTAHEPFAAASPSGAAA
jgi:hypothetical protein